MWKISKENCEDLGFAIICMFYDAINLSEFKLWLDIVVRDTPIDKIPLYIFDLIDFDKSIGEIYDLIGVVNYGYISNDQKNALTGIAFLERVHSLRSRTPKKAKATICRLVLNLRSQFFQSRLFFSNQEKLRSTTHRFGNTAKRCNSFRLAISTSAPINSCTDEANALPV